MFTGSDLRGIERGLVVFVLVVLVLACVAGMVVHWAASKFKVDVQIEQRTKEQSQ